jgi:hypothetical protein
MLISESAPSYMFCKSTHNRSYVSCVYKLWCWGLAWCAILRGSIRGESISMRMSFKRVEVTMAAIKGRRGQPGPASSLDKRPWRSADRHCFPQCPARGLRTSFLAMSCGEKRKSTCCVCQRLSTPTHTAGPGFATHTLLAKRAIRVHTASMRYSCFSAGRKNQDRTSPWPTGHADRAVRTCMFFLQKHASNQASTSQTCLLESEAWPLVVDVSR